MQRLGFVLLLSPARRLGFGWATFFSRRGTKRFGFGLPSQSHPTPPDTPLGWVAKTGPASPTLPGLISFEFAFSALNSARCISACCCAYLSPSCSPLHLGWARRSAADQTINDKSASENEDRNACHKIKTGMIAS